MMLEGCSSGWPDEGVSWLSPGIKGYALVGTFVPTSESYCSATLLTGGPFGPKGTGEPNFSLGLLFAGHAIHPGPFLFLSLIVS
jgi:hypothetical protein